MWADDLLEVCNTQAHIAPPGGFHVWNHQRIGQIFTM